MGERRKVWGGDVPAPTLTDAWIPLVIVASGVLLTMDLEAATLVPIMWPPAALLAGWLLRSRLHPAVVLAAGGVGMVAAQVVAGVPVAPAAGFGLTSTVAAWLVVRRLVHGLDGAPRLMVEGDVSRMIGAIAVGSFVGGAGSALTCLATGHGDWRLGLVAGFGAHASALMVLLPFFLRTPAFEALAGPQERAVQAAITLGTTVAVFAFADFPPVVFAVMPMFAWHAFRGRVREASVLLAGVSVIGIVATLGEHGPIWGFLTRYDVPPEIALAVFQLFLLDCGLILLPLSVMATQQRMSAASVAAERSKLERLVAQATGTAVVTTDAEGRVAMFNPGAEQMFGLSAADVIGDLPDRLWSAEELERQSARLLAEPTFQSICAASVAAGDVDRLWRFERPDGEQRMMRMNLTAIPDEQGHLSGYLATAEDITEREAAHVALVSSLTAEREAMEKLREAERVKSDLLATVSHELRTPLSSILGYLEVLEDGSPGPLNHKQADLLQRIDRNGRRLQRLVEDLLTMSQAETSTLAMEASATDLCSIVRRAHDAVQPLLQDRDLDFRIFVPRRPLVREGDPVLLERMVVNLLSNAVKFTPDGGRVHCQLTDSGGGTTIVVRDTGVGILEHEQQQLFSRFFRSSVAREGQVQGTGLGLAIVKTIVSLHRGTVGIESTPGEGTTVTVTLPRMIFPSVGQVTESA